MNLKERLTSTENLLRSIRSTGSHASPAQGHPAPAPAEKQSIWTRKLTMGDVAALFSRRKAAPPQQPAAPAPWTAAPQPAPQAAPRPAAAQPAQEKQSIWTRRISLGDVFSGLLGRSRAPKAQQIPAPPSRPLPPPASSLGAPAQARYAAAPATPPQASAQPQPPQDHAATALADGPRTPATPRSAETPHLRQEPPEEPLLRRAAAEPLADAPRTPEAARFVVTPRAAAGEAPADASRFTVTAQAPQPSPHPKPIRPAQPAPDQQPRPAPRVEAEARSVQAEATLAAQPFADGPRTPAASRTSATQRHESGMEMPAARRSAPRQQPIPADPWDDPEAVPAAYPSSGTPVPFPAAAPAAPGPKPAALPFWKRPISFSGGGKAFSVGVSFSGATLCLAALRSASGAIVASRRIPMTPDQLPGERGFPALLRAGLETLGYTAANAEVYAVLRSLDLDLNVVSVPKLSGGKLDAAVYWTLQKEKKFAEAEYVLDYLVMGPTPETRDPKLDVLTCLARRAEVERLREAFREAGSPLSGITAIPNAFVNLYRMPGAPRGFTLAANIHVEQDFSTIGLYTRDRLVFSRFIRSGTGSMAETLSEHFKALSRPKGAPVLDMELPMPGGARHPGGAQGPQVQPISPAQAHDLMRHVLLGGPRPAFAQAEHLISPAEMLGIVAPAIERLARQVERTLDYYAGAKQGRCDAMHVSGDIFGSPAVVQELGGQLGFTPLPFDATAIIAAGRELVAPADRMAMAPTLAAAMAQGGKNINLLHNYKVRTAQEGKRTATRFLILGLAALMLVIGGLGLVLERANADKKLELRRITTQLTGMGPSVDEGSIQATLAQFKQRQDALREAASRLLAPAALAEISRRAPENVKILSFTADYPQPEAAKTAAGQPPAQAPAPADPKAPLGRGSVVVEGVVTGSKVEFDATLSRFVLNIQASPMFNLPVVDQTGLKELGGGGQVLYFVLRVGVK